MVFIILIAWIKAGAQEDPFDPIVKAIKESDARSLAASFNMTVELRLPDTESTYSASQGEMIMKDFFKNYPPDSFSIIQKGTTDPVTMFAICSYESGEKKYQAYIHLHKEKEKYLIQKIKFEEKK